MAEPTPRVQSTESIIEVEGRKIALRICRGVTVNFTVGGRCSLVVHVATTNYAAGAKRQGELLPGREPGVKRILASDAEF